MNYYNLRFEGVPPGVPLKLHDFHRPASACFTFLDAKKYDYPLGIRGSVVGFSMPMTA